MVHGSGHVHHAHTAVVYGYDGWGTYYYRRRLVGCVCFWIWFVIVIIITGSIVGSTVGTRGSSGTGSLQYYYEQTSIVGKDVNFVCPILQLEYSRDGYGINTEGTADLYALSEPPILSAGPNITLESYSSLYVYKYKSWSYYMYEGTVASLDVCHISSGQSTAKLLMIRGKSNFNNWKLYNTDTYVYQKYDIPDCQHHFVNRFTVPQGSSDVWYVVLDAGTDADSTPHDVDILLYTQQYQIKDQYVLDHCRVSAFSALCTIPASNGATYALSVGPPGHSHDYTNTVKLKCSCITNTGILAAVIVCPVVFLIIVTTILTIILVCCCLKKKKYAIVNPNGTVQQPLRNVVTVKQGTVIQPLVPTEKNLIYPTQPRAPPPYVPAPSTFPCQPSGYQPAN